MTPTMRSTRTTMSSLKNVTFVANLLSHLWLRDLIAKLNGTAKSKKEPKSES
ncbi:hypothetical protein OESDEN_14685, partial [Oesophagostomum dentatum]